MFQTMQKAFIELTTDNPEWATCFSTVPQEQEQACVFYPQICVMFDGPTSLRHSHHTVVERFTTTNSTALLFQQWEVKKQTCTKLIQHS